MRLTNEQARLRLSKNTGADKKSRFGQFLTPPEIAAFMAGLFSETGGNCRLLDAGAGIGSLSSAFLERCRAAELDFDEIHLSTFELDETLHRALRSSLYGYADRLPISYEFMGGDFIEAAVNEIQFGQGEFTHAILNPPYRKINSNSRYRLLLRQVSIETVKLNVFHENKSGLPEALARGLAVFLNSSAVDEHFRRFSGHTQVNATDLKLLKYPSRETLGELGEWAMQHEELAQNMIDEKFETLTP